MCPAEVAESISSIDIAKLKRLRISALLIDLDNTLVPWQRYNITPAAVDWLQKARDNGLKVCIVSNTRSTGRLNKLSLQLGVPAKQAMKPRRKGFNSALELLGAEPSGTAVIGDQIFTDILGGNRLGMYTVLVRPISGREFFGTKISRFFEFLLLRFFGKRGVLSI